MPHFVSVVVPEADHFSMRAALDDPGSAISRLIWQTMGTENSAAGKLQKQEA